MVIHKFFCSDIFKLRNFCSKYELYNAMMHCYIVVKNEYLYPLDRFMKKLRAEYPNRDKGNLYTVSNYFSCLTLQQRVGKVVMLSLRNVFKGDIPPQHRDQLLELKLKVLELIFTFEQSVGKPRYAFTTLLDYNPKSFFDVLYIAMKDETQTSPWQTSSRQEKVDILIETLIDKGRAPDVVDTKAIDIKAEFFLFLAKMVSQGLCTISDDNIHRTFTHLVYFFTCLTHIGI